MNPPPQSLNTQAVFFDVGDTLVHVHPSVGEVYAGVAAGHGAKLEPGDVQGRFDEAWDQMRSGIPPGANRYRVFPGGELGWWREIVRRSFAGTGFDPDPHFTEFFGVFAGASAWRAFPEAERTLEGLRARGLRLGVISNWDSRLPALLEALGLRRYFSLVLYSSAEDVEKPAQEIFRRAARRCGVKPAHALHVGDRLEEDYRGARAAGLRAVLVDRKGKLALNGADVVHDLSQLGSYL